MKRLWRALTTLLRGIGSALRWLRRLALTAITLVVVLALFGQLNRPAPSLPDSAVLALAPSGQLVDQLSYIDPFNELLNPTAAPAETLLPEFIAVIDHAANNPAITAVVLDTQQLQSADMAKILELGDALLRFRASGKPIVATADSYDSYQYLLASHADRIFMHHFGAVEISSMQAQRSYFADLLERLQIDFHLFRAGEFKDAVEPLTRSGMSASSRQQLQRLVDQRWQLYSDRISTNRNLPRGAVDDLVANYADKLRASGGDFARLAEQSGLVDSLSDRSQRRTLIADWLRAQSADAAPRGEPEQVDSASYAAWLRRNDQQRSAPATVIVYTAAGEILDGQQSAGQIGGDSSAEQLQELVKQQLRAEQPTALVVRIDSPGGSACASEVVREQLQFARDHGMAVVVSMGSTAASGGYWIATGADYLVAQPATLTGSIGVFGLVPTVNRGLESLGVNFEQVSSSPAAAAYHPQQPLSEAAAAIFQSSVDGLYQRFLQRVSDARQLSLSQTEQLAGGQVWSGGDALELGLVDRLGGLDQAIDAAAEIAGFSDYQVTHYQPQLTPWEQFVTTLNQQLSAFSARSELAALLSPLLGGAALPGTAQSLGQLRDSLNDPQARYLLCTLCQ